MNVANPVKVCGPPSKATATGFALKAREGASFTAVTAMVKMFVVRSTPPSAVPPLSCAMTVTVADPLALAAGVKVSVPLAASAGGTLKRPLPLCEMV